MSWGQKLGGAALVMLATRGIGCTYATPKVDVPAQVPAFSPCQLELAEVTVKNKDKAVPSEVTHYVHAATRDILAEASRARGGGAGAAKLRVHVDLEDEVDYMATVGAHDGCAAVPLLVAAPAGANIESSKLSVDVDLEAGGRRFQGHGEADKAGSLYVDARRRALAVALDRALADATKLASK